MYTPQQIAQGLQAQQRMQQPTMPQQGQIPMSMQRQPQGGLLGRSVQMPQNLQVR